MGWIGVLLGSLAAIIFFFVSNHIILCILALSITMGCFWSWGVMHNYATEMAKRRLNYTGQFFDITPEDTHAVPAWITRINMGFTIGSIIIFLLSIFEKNTLHIIVGKFIFNMRIIGAVSLIVIVECFCAYAAYFIIRKIFKVQALKVLAIGACLLGLIVGWTAGYRIERAVVAQTLYESENRSYRQTKGTDMPKEEWLSVYSRYMDNNTELGYLLHKKAAIYSIPPFIFVLFFMLRLAKRHESKDFNQLDDDAYMERICREAEERTAEEARRRAASPIPEKTQQNEEFIALLKSAVNEKRIDTIPDEDLLELCNRARQIAAFSNTMDIELSKAINNIVEEIKKRGLSPEKRPQGISVHEVSSFPKKDEAGGTAKWGYATPVIAIVSALIVIASFVIIISNKEKVGQNKAAVTESTYSLKETQEAAERGDARAQTILGWMYNTGKGVTPDYKEAVKWYTKAAEQGEVTAQTNLGVMYHNGNGVTQDYKEAVKWWTKAAVQGNAKAQDNMGVMYYEGKGATQDYKEAVKWYTKAAEQGDAGSQFRLGWMYAEGKGVTQDYNEAAKWYTKAAEQRYAIAQNYLGVMYDTGKGVMQDYKEAVKWYTKAAEQGETFAQHNLGVMYYNGKGVLKNFVEAYKWWNLAAAGGIESAIQARDYLITFMTPEQIAEAQRLSREFTPQKKK